MPEDLATEEVKTIVLSRTERQLMTEAEETLLKDLRFEYLEPSKIEAEVRRFVALSNLDKAKDHLPDFITRFARDPMDRRCFFPLLYLTIPDPYEIAGITLLPLSDQRIPATDQLDTAPPCGGVASVPVRGTNYRRMEKRAREQAQYVVGLLRIGLRRHPQLSDRQLRFHLRETYAFDDGFAGGSIRDDAAWETTLAADMRQLFEEQPLSTLLYNPRNDVETKAKLALNWMDRARLATEPLVAVLYLFFALEGLLGDKAERLKAHGLVFRRTVLGHAVTGSFSNPLRLYYLYDQVRSYAVHGSEAPDVSPSERSSFDQDVRLALNEYLSFAREQQLTRQPKVVAALNKHQDAAQVLQWLRDHDCQWENFPPRKAQGKRAWISKAWARLIQMLPQSIRTHLPR